MLKLSDSLVTCEIDATTKRVTFSAKHLMQAVCQCSWEEYVSRPEVTERAREQINNTIWNMAYLEPLTTAHGLLALVKAIVPGSVAKPVPVDEICARAEKLVKMLSYPGPREGEGT